MCNDVKFDINLKLTKFALKWVLTWRDSFTFKYCNHGNYVKFHLRMKRLHPRAGPSSRHMAIILVMIIPSVKGQYFEIWDKGSIEKLQNEHHAVVMKSP